MTTTPISGRSLRTSSTPLATTRRASTSRPESVSSRMAMSGWRSAIWRISFRFFSPPEKPSLRCRSAKAGSISRRSIHSMSDRRISRAERSTPLRALSAWRRKFVTETPGTAWGYWKARNRPALARTSTSQCGDVVAVQVDRPADDPVLGAAQQGLGQRRLAGAVGAHDGVDLSRPDGQVHPGEDGRAALGGCHPQAAGLEQRSVHDRQSNNTTAVVEIPGPYDGLAGPHAAGRGQRTLGRTCSVKRVNVEWLSGAIMR